MGADNGERDDGKDSGELGHILSTSSNCKSVVVNDLVVVHALYKIAQGGIFREPIIFRHLSSIPSRQYLTVDTNDTSVMLKNVLSYISSSWLWVHESLAWMCAAALTQLWS